MSAAAVNAYANRLAWEEAGTVWDSASHCSTVWPLRPYGLGKAVLLLALAPEVEGWRPRTANMSIKRYQTYPEYLEELRGTWEHFPCASLATCGGSSAPGLSWVLLPVVGCGQTKAPCNWTLCVTWYLRDACVKLVLPKTNSKPRVQKQVPCWMCPGSCHNWVVTTDAPPLRFDHHCLGGTENFAQSGPTLGAEMLRVCLTYCQPKPYLAPKTSWMEYHEIVYGVL